MKITMQVQGSKTVGKRHGYERQVGRESHARGLSIGGIRVLRGLTHII